ncbi:MAG: helix-turn-helix transcriptional regulator [Pseudomonadota bacterium]
MTSPPKDQSASETNKDQTEETRTSEQSTRKLRSKQEIMNEQGARLKLARERKFRSASDAARELRVPVPTYSAHESGLRGIKSVMADYYARMLDVTTSWLMSGTGSIEDSNNSDGLIQKSEMLSNELYASLYNLENDLNVTFNQELQKYVKFKHSNESIELVKFRNEAKFLPLLEFTDSIADLEFEPSIVAFDDANNPMNMNGQFYVSNIIPRECKHAGKSRQLFAYRDDWTAGLFESQQGVDYGIFEKGHKSMQLGVLNVVLVLTPFGDILTLTAKIDYSRNTEYYSPDNVLMSENDCTDFQIIASAAYYTPKLSNLIQPSAPPVMPVSLQRRN